jgi:hypothetical protein
MFLQAYRDYVKNVTSKYSMEIMIIVICLAAIVGLGSIIVTGRDHNEVEEISEEIIDKELGLPKGTVDLDFHDLSKKKIAKD